MHLFVVPRDGDALLDMFDIELLNVLQINCSTISTRKKGKGVKYENIRNDINVSEWCYANTGLEKDCHKKDNSAESCANSGSSLNSHNRPSNASLPMSKDNTIN